MPAEVLEANVIVQDDALVEDPDSHLLGRNRQVSESEEEPSSEEEGPAEEDQPQLKRSNSVQRELADAIVRHSPLEELRILIECGALVDAPLSRGLTPLHYAVWQNYPEAAQLLIDEGCDVNARDDIGFSPLHLAAEHGFTDLIRLLLKNGAVVNFNDSPFEDYPIDAFDEPLRSALKNNHLEAARILLENGASPNTCYFFGHEINLINPLNIDLLELLLSFGADPNAMDRNSFTPLMKACRMSQGMEAVLLNISYGADVNSRADSRHDYRSVLHYAVISGSLPIVNLLIKQGAMVNFEPAYQRPSPLDLAILKSELPMIKLLVKAGANVRASTPVIGTPLHMACSEGVKNRYEIIEYLLEQGADPNQVVYNEEGMPLKMPLGEYLASNEDADESVVKLLLKYGAEVIMQSQTVNPKGILTSLSRANNPHVLLSLLEAAQKFDLKFIRQTSQITEDQRSLFLRVGSCPLPLKHLVRLFLRHYLGRKLPHQVDDLQVPSILKKYVSYEIS